MIAAVQELERALEGSSVRARSGVARADGASTAQPLAPHLVQFAEAQRIIVLDAIRTDFPQSGQKAAASSSSSTPAMKGEALIPWHHRKAVVMQNVSLCIAPKRSGYQVCLQYLDVHLNCVSFVVSKHQFSSRLLPLLA